VGLLGADVGSDGDRAAFRFDGTDVAVTVRRGPYRALLFVTVDGEPANQLPRDEAGRAYLVLTDRGADVATVPLATGLEAGLHTVEVVAERGQGQWALVSWHVGAGLVRDRIGWYVAGLGLAGLALAGLLVRDARRVDWAGFRNAFLRWPEWAQVGLTAGLTGALWLAAANWDANLIQVVQDLSVGFRPWLLIGLLALPILVALFAARLDLGLALVAFGAPFYLHPDHMVHGALSVPEVLVLLCGAGLAVRARNADWHGGGGPRARLTLLDGGVGLLALATVVAGLFAADPHAAVFELRTVFLFPVLYYGLVRLARPDDKARWRIVAGWALGAVAVALIGLVQYPLGLHVSVAEGGLPRLQSVFSSPNRVGLYLGRVWPILLALAVWGGGRRRRALCGLALLPVMLALLLSFSRGALLLGLPVALLVMGWRAGGRWRWLALAVVAIGVLAFVPLLLSVPRFGSMLDLEEGSSFFRLSLWRSSLALICEHPWFGVGPGQFQAAYRTRYILPGAWSEPDLGHPHNIMLDHWTRLGLLGLLAGLVVQVAFWRAAWPGGSSNHRGGKSVLPAAARSAGLHLGLAGSMAALLAHGLVDNTLFYPDLALAFFLTLALVEEMRY
jgi:O-antigen ligase